MIGITQAVNALAAQLGLAVDWEVLHSNLSAPPVAALISAAADTTFNARMVDRHQQEINEMLDDAAGRSRPDEGRQDIAAALANLSLTLHDEHQTAVNQARELIIPLTELGVLVPAA